MAEKYIVNASDMTLVADTTRNRAGIDNSLAFPDGFADTIAAEALAILRGETE